MKKRIVVSMLMAAIGLASAELKASMVNEFSPTDEQWLLPSSTDGWVVDRYPPSSFGATVVDDRFALQIGIDPANGLNNRPGPYQDTFYNTQGFQTPTGFGSNDWSVSASLLVTPDLTNGSPSAYRSDIWARTGTTNDESVAQYFILGLFVGDTNVADGDPDNMAPTNASAVFRVWDDVDGVWNILNVPVTNGWNDVTISAHGKVVRYFLNEKLVYTETNIAFPGYEKQLTTVFLEAYNFGGPAYAATWANDLNIDRFQTESVTTTNVDGKTAWDFHVDPSGFQGTGSFYDYQGYQVPANVNTNSHWAAYGTLYVPTNVADGSFSPVNESLWVDTADADGPEDYYIIGLFSGDASNRANPSPTSPTVSWEVFDDINGVWDYLPTPVTPGWHALRISQDNGGIYYYIDSNLVYTVTGDAIGVPDAIDDLDTVFLETYNFGGPAYDAIWADVGDTDASKPFLPNALTITTITLSTQPGFSAELLTTTNLSPVEIWTPVADAPVLDGTEKYQFFRASIH